MSHLDPVSVLYDAVLDFAAERTMAGQPPPAWEVKIGDVPRGYRVAIAVDAKEHVNVFGRSLSDALRDAADKFREWRNDQPEALVGALEASIAKVQAERGTVSR